jgi:hypothetical protein
MRLRLAFAATATTAVLAAGCMTPARDVPTYQEKADEAVKAAMSETATVRLIVKQALDGRIMYAYADQSLSKSEDALGSVADQFDSVQPPDDSKADAVNKRISSLLSDASDTVTSVRISYRRHDNPELRKGMGDLADVIGRLQGAEDALP